MRNITNINLYYAFHCLGKHGSFELAMKELNVSRSTLYRKVKELEVFFGKGELISNHTKGGVSLTSFGEDIFQKVSCFINDLDTAQEVLLSQTNLLKKQDVIKIITTSGFISLMVVNAIVKYQHINPRVIFEVQVIEEDFIPDHYVFDMAFFPKMFINKQKYLVETIGDSYLQWFASDMYLKTHGIPASVKDLEHHNVIKFHLSDKEIRGPTDWAFFDNVISHPANLSMNSFLGRLFAVSIGYGIACFPVKIMEMFPLKLVRLENLPERALEIVAISSKHKYVQKSVRDFFHFAIEESRIILKV